MRSGHRFGLVSLWLSGVAVACVFAAVHGESFRYVGSGHLLNWLYRQGLVKGPRPTGVAELSSPGTLALTDELALKLLLLNGLFFAAYAVLFALWAEYKRENTQYLSAGFILGASAIMLTSPIASMAVMVGGAAVVLVLRRASRA
jgi:hypothetical protein